MSGHIHAELMAQYAEDARETETPWERWEYRHTGFDHWKPCKFGDGKHFGSHLQYRRKPRTITINGREVPEPMRQAPELMSPYFLTDCRCEGKCKAHIWRGDSIDTMWLSRGLCHSTEEAAIAHAEALLSFTESK